MPNLQLLILTLSAYLTLLTTSLAQHPIPWHYTVADGLPSSLVYQIVQDHEGYLWFATDRGVARFDGYDFEQFGTQDGLPSNDVWGLEVDASGKLWAATFNSPCYFDKGRFHILPNHTGVEIGKVEFYQMDEKGNRFFSTKGGHLFQISPEDSLIRLNKMLGKSSYPLFMSEDKNGVKWFCTLKKQKSQSGISMNRHFFQQVNADVFKPAGQVTSQTVLGFFPFIFSRKNDVVSFTRTGYHIFDYTNDKYHGWEEFFEKKTTVHNIVGMGKERCILSTSHGYHVIDSALNILSGFDFLNQYNLNRIYEDRGGNLWLCTLDDGVYFLSANAFQSASFRPAKSLSGNEILSLDMAPDGTLWAGTSAGQLFAFQDERFRELAIEGFNTAGRRLLDHHIWPQNGTLISATDAGLLLIPKKNQSQSSINAKLHAGTLSEITIADVSQPLLISTSMKTLAPGQNGTFWAGYQSGVMRFSLTEGEAFLQQSPQHGKPTYALATNPNGDVWMGRKDGLFFFHNDSIIEMQAENTLFHRPINDLQIDSRGHLWIATDGFGLYRYLEGQVDTIHEMERDIVKSIFIDKKDRVWAATNKGVRKITPANSEDFECDFFYITTAHGLASSEVNCVFVKGDDIFVGTKNGLTHLNDHNLIASTKPPLLRFTEVSVNGKTKTLQDTFRLKPNENRIQLNYVCLSYKSTGKVDYWYQMESLDSTWRKTHDLKKEYTSLSPGWHTFRLKARDINGNMSPEKTITLFIQRPWWQHWWAILGFVSIVGLSIFTFVKWRIRSVKEKADEQTAINKRQAELELEALQAQMNPHFVFNAMQSIQHFIFQKDERTANRYMVKFSRLMRLFLESSRHRFISLADEIQMLRFYTELEHMRFPDKFDFEIKVDETLNIETTNLPSMLIQPFVENAINHGLVPLSEKGRLTISFVKSKDYLKCTVDDNGVGRKKAKQLREHSFKHHKSRGMQIVEERLRASNLIHEKGTRIEVLDKYGPDGLAIGTEVQVLIPLE